MIHGQFQYRMSGDRLYTPGVNWGYGVQFLGIIHKGERFLVIKRPGATGWSGVGQSPSYTPVEYAIVEIGLGTDFPLMRMIKYCKPGRWWRRWMKKYIKQAKDMEEIWKANPESYMVDIDERYGAGLRDVSEDGPVQRQASSAATNESREPEYP